MIDSLGMITVQRCQNSAPAGFILRVSGGSIGEHGAVLFAESNNGLVQSGPNVEPERGSVRRLHAICFEVESNLIR